MEMTRPSPMMTVTSLRGGAPVPSMTVACSITISGAALWAKVAGTKAAITATKVNSRQESGLF
jgi:hypothetical protein